jgi:uncharacterized repeat protein (TIGR04076 family)
MSYRIIFTVIESKGDCQYYKPGDQITFEGAEIVREKSDRLCYYALSSFIPYLSSLRRPRSGEEHSDRREIIHPIQCPDYARPVVFKVEREPM